MTLVQTLDSTLSEDGVHAIGPTAWDMTPWSIYFLKEGTLSSALTWLKVDILISNATTDECRSSGIDYIINCKRWVDQNDLKKHWAYRYKEHIKERR